MTFRIDPDTLLEMMANAEEGEPFHVALISSDDPEHPTVQEISGTFQGDGSVRFTPTEATERVPSGEHTSADTDDVVGRIDDAIEDWEGSEDSATWCADGSHEHDPPWWTRQDMGGESYREASRRFYDRAIDRANHEAGPASHPGPAFTWTFRDPDVDTDRLREIFSAFIDGLRELCTAARPVLERLTNPPYRIQAQLGRRSDREYLVETMQEYLRHRSWREAACGGQVAPHADLEPLNLPRIEPGDEMQIRWNNPHGAEVIEAFNRRTRPSWTDLP